MTDPASKIDVGFRHLHMVMHGQWIKQTDWINASSLPPKRAKAEIQGSQRFGYSVFIGFVDTEKLYFMEPNVTKQCVQSWMLHDFFFIRK